MSLIFLCGLIKIIAKTHAKLYNVFVGEIMFDIDELKKLKELENQTVHCLWPRQVGFKACRTWKWRARPWNL